MVIQVESRQGFRGLYG